jgi:hypothetical protein
MLAVSTQPHDLTGRQQSRRAFIQATGASAVAAAAVPLFLGAQNKSGSKRPVLGTGDHTYEVVRHAWGELPDHVRWGETHGVAIDEAGLVYIKHRSSAPEPIDAIVVFDGHGTFVRSFGKEYHGGGHGIDIRKEGSEEFLYLSDIKNGIVAKTSLKGDVVWRKGVPQEPGVYADPKAKYSPTNVAFAPDGGFYIGDGYGSHYIHQYDRDARWVRTWGGFGSEPGKMKTPHGLWLDNRPGRDLALVVADRANARLQYFALDGTHLGFVGEMSFPAHFDIRGTDLLVPDLHARVTILDKDNRVITHLGYDKEWTTQVLANNFEMRRTPANWVEGKFIHPHDACWDKNGNLFVVEWVPTGRVSFLRRV